MKTETVISIRASRRDADLVHPPRMPSRDARTAGRRILCAASREGDPFAIRFMAEGFNAFVLNYSIGKRNRSSRARSPMCPRRSSIRENAEKYCIDPDKLFVIGIVGGRLPCRRDRCHVALRFCKSSPRYGEYGANRPNGVILTYGVVSTREDIRCFCFDNLVTEEYGEQAVSL